MVPDRASTRQEMISVNPSRRSIIAGAAALLPPVGKAQSFGRIARPELVRMLLNQEATEMGQGALVQVLVSPGCVESSLLLNAAETLLDRCRWRFIVFAGPVTVARENVARQRGARDFRSLAALVREDAQSATAAPSSSQLSAVMEQDREIEMKIGRLLWEATFSAFATPTAVFTDSAGLVRVVRGNPRPEDVSWIVSEAR